MLAVQKQKKLDAGKLGTGTSERDTRCREAYH